MVGHECTCVFFWPQNLDKVMHNYIKISLQFQASMQELQGCKTMDETKTKYHVIRLWWLSFGGATNEGILALSEWLGFGHFYSRQ